MICMVKHINQKLLSSRILLSYCYASQYIVAELGITNKGLHAETSDETVRRSLDLMQNHRKAS